MIAVSFGAIPFLAGRTTLAVGLIVASYTLRVMVQEREFSPRTLFLGLFALRLSGRPGEGDRVRSALE